jgi:phosphoadenosine phosphosulfate reductase
LATGAKYSAAQAEELSKQLEGKTPQEIIAWSFQEFGSNIGFASSFGAEDVAMIDMIAKVAPGLRVFTLDTGRLHDETYYVMDQMRQRYGLQIETVFPEREAVETLVRGKGFYSFQESIENRKECCFIRKVQPLQRVLKGLDAWMTGLRRDQAVTRANTAIVEIDDANGGLAKVNPLVDWSNDDVWAYIKTNDVPYNPLHDQGFPSIGCAPCTRAIEPGEDIRAGRWWWELPEYKECGLHPGIKTA